MSPTTNGIIESAIYVDDLERSGHFYETVLGFERLMADARMRAYSAHGRTVFLIFKKGGSVRPTETPGGTIPPHDGDGHLHFAFAVEADQLAAWERRLAERGVAVESRVRCAGGTGGTSLYFRDPDGHCVELITPGCWAIY